MGVGTAITVAAIASIAVGPRGFAGRLAKSKRGAGLIFVRGLETAAALALIAFVVLLLKGYMVSERRVGVYGAGLLLAAASRDTKMTNKQTATVSFDSEARVSAGTDEISKINTLIQTVKSIPPDVARSIEQQVHQPAYDCNQMPCSVPLQHRNYVARSQLRKLIAQKTQGDQAQHAAAHR
jgi:hypothetical protein